MKHLTPSALLDLPKPPNGNHYELSDGELIVVGNAGALHELIKASALEIPNRFQICRTGNPSATPPAEHHTRV
jgi:Uma2 family endonuclease